MVEGSHRLPGFAGLRDTLGKVDVNYTEITGGFQFSDPAEVLAYDPAARLVTEDFRGPRSLFRRSSHSHSHSHSLALALCSDTQNFCTTAAGDVVVFGMFMLHGSSINCSGSSASPPKLRLSCDIRFQPAADPVDKRHTADGRICRGIDERNRHPGPHKSMREALEEWGLVREPVELDELPEAKL